MELLAILDYTLMPLHLSRHGLYPAPKQNPGSFETGFVLNKTLAMTKVYPDGYAGKELPFLLLIKCTALPHIVKRHPLGGVYL